MDWPEGVDKRIFDSLDSTNAEAVRQANDGTYGPVWIFTPKQTAGRARRGRTWSDDGKNFSATLLMYPKDGLEKAAMRSFIASLALREALVEVCGREDVFTLKWPNDVLLHGQKLAGILLESGDCKSGHYLCVGMGVNLNAKPAIETLEQGALHPVSLVEATGISISASDFLPMLARAFAHWEDVFTTYGFEPIRIEWLKHAAGIGDVVTAKLPSHTETGVFETIDESGAIIIKTAKGRVILAAADIHFGMET